MLNNVPVYLLYFFQNFPIYGYVYKVFLNDVCQGSSYPFAPAGSLAPAIADPPALRSIEALGCQAQVAAFIGLAAPMMDVFTGSC